MVERVERVDRVESTEGHRFEVFRFLGFEVLRVLRYENICCFYFKNKNLRCKSYNNTVLIFYYEFKDINQK